MSIGVHRSVLIASSGKTPGGGGFTAVLVPENFTANNRVYCDAEYEVDWGSGSFTTYPAGNADSIASGNITVRSVGIVTHFKVMLNTITGVDLTNADSLTSLNGAFNAKSKITSFAATNTGNITDFSGAWGDCFGLTSFPVIDTSAGVNFEGAWARCWFLTSFPLLDFSAGVNFKTAWRLLQSVTTFPAVNVVSGNDFSNAFEGSNNITSIPVLNTSNGTLFGGMFQDCSSLATIGAIDTTNTVGVSTDMFLRCSSLTAPDAATQTSLASASGFDYN